jgi:hypothetical protein
MRTRETSIDQIDGAAETPTCAGYLLVPKLAERSDMSSLLNQ